MPETYQNPIPTVLAFLICESVIHDAETQKKTLVGVFDRLLASSVPTSLSGLGLYAKMVEGSGLYTFKIRMIDLSDDSRLFELEAQANWQHPENPLEFGVNIRGLSFPKFGSYEFQLVGGEDMYLGRAAFRVELMPAGGFPFNTGG